MESTLTTNIINSNYSNPKFSELAIKLLNSLEEPVIFAYENSCYGDLDEYGTRTQYCYRMYIISLEKNGSCRFRLFCKEFIRTDFSEKFMVDVAYDEVPMYDSDYDYIIYLLKRPYVMPNYAFKKVAAM